MKPTTNRRDFMMRSIQSLGAIGLSQGTIASLMGAIYSRALATEAQKLKLNEKGFRYVFVNLYGAPPRWMFDMPPTPMGSSPSNYVSGGFGNSFEISGQTIQLQNRTFTYNYGSGKSLFLPPVWGMSPTGLDFTSILPHALFVRGIDMEINSHPVSNARQVAPISGGHSLHGVVADQMGSPIAAVVTTLPSGAAFKSAKGLGSTPANPSGNPIDAIIAPFRNMPNSIPFRQELAKPVVTQFLDRIDRYAKINKMPGSTLRNALDSADQLIRLNIDSLAALWPGLLNKYTDIVNRGIRPSKGELPGVYDKIIPCVSGDLRLRFRIQDSNLMDHSDARDMIQSDSTHAQMSRQFALTEFLLTTGMSSCVDLAAGTNVLDKALVRTGLSVPIIADQHGVGAVTSIVATTLYYRALLGSLTELVSSLKSQQLFDKTVLHISSEFNRNPRVDGSGSDHGVRGGNSTIISGMFDEVSYIGNIQKNGFSGSPGTWGLAADWTFEDGTRRPIKVNDIARTITGMTNSAEIVANGYSLVRPAANGKWTPKTSGGENV
ncbi:MAG: DUF1501 domain-containing protein [Deltaproteobacteria bacterium]|nr:DUF1501 domain-containing protein [Deltaproteobacteria bacterium]